MTIYKYNIRMKSFLIQVVVLLVLLTSCSSEMSSAGENGLPTFELMETIEEVKTLSPTVTSVTDPTFTPAATEFIIKVSSPLIDFSMNDLANMISNPYHPPKQGSDGPHQGIDFSVMDPDLRIAVKGSGVRAILGGQVVMVMKDRFPYGNALMVETPYQEIPVEWAEKLSNHSDPGLFGTSTSLTCPAGWDQVENERQELSVYILYAHLQNPSEFKLGDQIGSGDGIGSIGDSGNALAPHLHIEMRYGYSGGLKGSMAHYDVSADEQEMSNYCRWRVSGWYRTIDPMEMLFTTTNANVD